MGYYKLFVDCHEDCIIYNFYFRTNKEETRRNNLLKPIYQYNYQGSSKGDILLTTEPLNASNVSAAQTNILSSPIPTFYPDNDYIKFQISYMVAYTLFIISCIILVSTRALLFYKICMNACRGLHNKMFSHVLKAPMRFFDTNPSGKKYFCYQQPSIKSIILGRILNRFSKDIGVIDEILPTLTIEACQIFLVMIGIISMVFIVTPWMIFPTTFLGGLFYYFRMVYLSTAQDVKRIEGVSKLIS